MFPQKAQIAGQAGSKTYPLGEKIEQPVNGPTMALVALSHTPVERQLYAAMLAALNEHYGFAIPSVAITTLTPAQLCP